MCCLSVEPNALTKVRAYHFSKGLRRPAYGDKVCIDLFCKTARYQGFGSRCPQSLFKSESDVAAISSKCRSLFASWKAFTYAIAYSDFQANLTKHPIIEYAVEK